MSEDILYSPWRIQYILQHKSRHCIFCISPDDNEAKHLVLFRSKSSFVIMNTFPYNNGHLLAVPNRHVASLNDLEGSEINDLFQTVQICEKVLKQVYHPDGLNIGINLGKAAGAGVEGHLHVHIVPRWLGDVNFMTVSGGIRVIPESFENAYGKLKEQFDNEKVEK